MNNLPNNYMIMALKIAEEGKLTAPPNPMVGCVIVKNDKIIGRGFHEAPGLPHAEINALAQAGADAENSTVFVTLEPCSHYGRTGPCTQALIHAKVKHVVVAVKDPDHRVSGNGINALRNAGIKVTLGVENELVEESLKAYMHHRKTLTPYCILKAGISLDGRVAAHDSSSQWITSEEARLDAHQLRAECQGILIGSETALKDKPKLNVRNVELPRNFKQPVRILLDARGRVDPNSMDVEVLFTSQEQNRDAWEKKGTDVILVKKIELPVVLSILGKRNIVQLLVEGGGQVHSSFVSEKLFNKLVVYIGSTILGDKGLPFLKGLDIHSIHDALRLKLVNFKKFKNDIRLDYACLQE